MNLKQVKLTHAFMADNKRHDPRGALLAVVPPIQECAQDRAKPASAEKERAS
jgi:hypothetical protein